MNTLMDMLMQSGNGEAIGQMARQYELNRQQAQFAVEALLPAFSEALKRNASAPADFMAFMKALSSGRHAGFFEHPEEALSPQGRREGEAILGHLFGSKEVSRAVAEQAAQATGLSQELMKSMLPTLAPIILGGLFKQMTDGATAAPGGAKAAPGGNPLGWILEQMAGGTAGGTAGGAGGGAAGNPWGRMMEEMTRGQDDRHGGGAADPWGKLWRDMMAGGQGGGAANPWGRMMEEMMRGGPAVPPTGQRQSGGAGDNPLGRIFEEMMRGDAPRPEEDGGRPAEPRGRGGGLGDLFGEMFDTGRKVQDDYARQMGSIFDDFLKGGRK